METKACITKEPRGLSVFEKYLTVFVFACIIIGILLGKVAPGIAKSLDSMAIYVNGAPVISIPIAICLFFMMYPIMVKIDFAEVLKAGKSVKPVGLTLVVNWAIKPFTMYFISLFFLGTVFYTLIGKDAVDLVKMPLGIDLPIGTTYGVGKVVLANGVKMLEVPLWRSYLAGCILLGVAPCTAMVLVWGYLAKGNDGHTLVMVAINSLTMLLLYGPIGGFLLGVGKLPVPWQALVLSIAIYVALPLFAGYVSRKLIIRFKGVLWFEKKFLHVLTPITIIALLLTLVLLFSFKGDVIISNPLTILWIAIPLFIQTNLIFWIGYGLSRSLKLTYEDAAPSAMIGASNHFEVAIATATMLFGLSSGAALAAFADAGIDVAVVEAGLGGRLDATNVLRTRVVLLTNVGLDHTDVLGESREVFRHHPPDLIVIDVEIRVNQTVPHADNLSPWDDRMLGACFFVDTRRCLANHGEALNERAGSHRIDVQIVPCAACGKLHGLPRGVQHVLQSHTIRLRKHIGPRRAEPPRHGNTGSNPEACAGPLCGRAFPSARFPILPP